MTGSYCKIKHQAAGHEGPFTDAEESLFFKPTTAQEVEFYQAIQSQSQLNDSSELNLNAWMPVYLGILERGAPENASQIAGDIVEPMLANTQCLEDGDDLQSSNKPVIVLENLLRGYRKPNILDIKLGRVLHDDTATEDKKARLIKVSQETTSGTLGIRICGMKIQENSLVSKLDPQFYDHDSGGYVSINKFYGRALVDTEVQGALELFFGNNALHASQRKSLYELSLQRLQLLYNALLDAEVRMISSSLLFIYEGDPTRWSELGNRDTILRDDFFQDSSDSEEEHVSSPLSSLTLIDFAHSRIAPKQGYDENVIHGIETLLGTFEALCAK